MLEHKNMADALKATYNVIVYQEQVMQVSVDLCGFSLSDADMLRKAMGKKDHELMEKYRKQFVEGAVSKSEMSPHDANALFDKIALFASYSFNKSHSVSYSMLGYICMWLKVKYPVEFFAASLSVLGEDKMRSITKDAHKNDVIVLPPDILRSTGRFDILDDHVILSPFNVVKGVQQKTVDAIMSIRKNHDIAGKQQFCDVIKEAGLASHCNVAQISKLDKVGAFANIESGQLAPTAPERVKDQLIFMPSVTIANIKGTKRLDKEHKILSSLSQTLSELGPHCKPKFGDRAKFMVVSDAPAWSEDDAGVFTQGKSFNYTSIGLKEAGMSIRDAYWTGLLKNPKLGKTITSEEFDKYGPALDKKFCY